MIILIPSAIMKPTAPIIRMPMAETFATVLNSRPVGFRRMCQTRLDWRMNDFSFPIDT